MTRNSRGTVRSWRARCIALVLSFGSAAVVGCSALSDPAAEANYVLATIAGVALPAPFFVSRDADGNVRTLEMQEGRMTLLPDDTFRWNLSALRKLNGEVVESLQVSNDGRVQRVGQTLILRFPSPDGYEERLDYEVLENGRQLAGPHFGRVYRWVRED